MESCKHKSKKECKLLTKSCKWAEGTTRQFCRTLKNKEKIDSIIKENSEKSKDIFIKSCKLKTNTRCTPHFGKMEPKCEISPKGRCVIKKIPGNSNKSKKKYTIIFGKGNKVELIKDIKNADINRKSGDWGKVKSINVDQGLAKIKFQNKKKQSSLYNI